MVIIRTIFFILHLVVLSLIFGTFLNAYIPPKWWSGFNLLSLLFPLLVFIHLVLTLIWLISFKKRAILFLISWVFLFNPVQRWVNYNKSENKMPDFKMLSYNSRGISQEKESFLNKQEVDILMLQESGWGERKKMKMSYFSHQATYGVLSIYSKFPILHHEKITLIDNGYAFYADIKVKDKIIRFLNIYLEPFKLEKTMVKPSTNLDVNEEKAKFLVSKLSPAFRTHQFQIEQIRRYIEKSPYPVVLAGDFNAVPNSYEYYQFVHLLDDAFVKAGKGSGTSFHDYKIPIRIDYVFASKYVVPLQYEVDRNVKLSDHYPIYTSFYFK